MAQKGIVDHFEGDYVIVEVDHKYITLPRPADLLGSGMVVIIEDGHIVNVDMEETKRIEDSMRRRFERILGGKSND